MRKLLGPKLNENDGTVWMSFNDFIKNYSKLTVCRVAKYFEARMPGCFERIASDTNDHILSKWYYLLVVEDESDKMFISIH
jgi:hypothetical protein